MEGQSGGSSSGAPYGTAQRFMEAYQAYMRQASVLQGAHSSSAVHPAFAGMASLNESQRAALSMSMMAQGVPPMAGHFWPSASMNLQKISEAISAGDGKKLAEGKKDAAALSAYQAAALGAYSGVGYPGMDRNMLPLLFTPPELSSASAGTSRSGEGQKTESQKVKEAINKSSCGMSRSSSKGKDSHRGSSSSQPSRVPSNASETQALDLSAKSPTNKSSMGTNIPASLSVGTGSPSNKDGPLSPRLVSPRMRSPKVGGLGMLDKISQKLQAKAEANQDNSLKLPSIKAAEKTLPVGSSSQKCAQGNVSRSVDSTVVSECKDTDVSDLCPGVSGDQNRLDTIAREREPGVKEDGLSLQIKSKDRAPEQKDATSCSSEVPSVSDCVTETTQDSMRCQEMSDMDGKLGTVKDIQGKGAELPAGKKGRRRKGMVPGKHLFCSKVNELPQSQGESSSLSHTKDDKLEALLEEKFDIAIRSSLVATSIEPPDTCKSQSPVTDNTESDSVQAFTTSLPTAERSDIAAVKVSEIPAEDEKANPDLSVPVRCSELPSSSYVTRPGEERQPVRGKRRGKKWRLKQAGQEHLTRLTRRSTRSVESYKEPVTETSVTEEPQSQLAFMQPAGCDPVQNPTKTSSSRSAAESRESSPMKSVDFSRSLAQDLLESLTGDSKACEPCLMQTGPCEDGYKHCSASNIDLGKPVKKSISVDFPEERGDQQLLLETPLECNKREPVSTQVQRLKSHGRPKKQTTPGKPKLRSQFTQRKKPKAATVKKAKKLGKVKCNSLPSVGEGRRSLRATRTNVDYSEAPPIFLEDYIEENCLTPELLLTPEKDPPTPEPPKDLPKKGVLGKKKKKKKRGVNKNVAMLEADTQVNTSVSLVCDELEGPGADSTDVKAPASSTSFTPRRGRSRGCMKSLEGEVASEPALPEEVPEEGIGKDAPQTQTPAVSADDDDEEEDIPLSCLKIKVENQVEDVKPQPVLRRGRSRKIPSPVSPPSETVQAAPTESDDLAAASDHEVTGNQNSPVEETSKTIKSLKPCLKNKKVKKRGKRKVNNHTATIVNDIKSEKPNCEVDSNNTQDVVSTETTTSWTNNKLKATRTRRHFPARPPTRLTRSSVQEPSTAPLASPVCSEHGDKSGSNSDMQNNDVHLRTMNCGGVDPVSVKENLLKPEPSNDLPSAKNIPCKKVKKKKFKKKKEKSTDCDSA